MKSLELNWIRKKCDKSIPMPEIMYYPFTGCSGCYYRPSIGNEIYDFDGKPHSLKYGVIAIAEYEANTIAHEWRHHWQHFNGIKFENSSLSLFKKFDYKEALKKYFITSKTELDALRFEHKYAGVFEIWEEILYDLLIGIKPKTVITYGNKTIKYK